MRDAQGNLYGTTTLGGPYPCASEGCGTVFEVTPAGVETTLYAFTGNADDGNPWAGLVQDAHGNLYGTTAFDEVEFFGPGTIFELTSVGTYKKLYSFRGGKDGCLPTANLELDAKGDLYGTTLYGGNGSCSQERNGGFGVVFEMTSSGKERVLYRFTGGTDGGNPAAGLVRDARGNLYGTTEFGGAYGWGTVFEVTPTGTEKALYSFTGGADGAIPYAGLVRDGKGNLYGTTYFGGNSSTWCWGGSCGVIFEITP